jgi:uncharacterized membrane protein
MAGIGALFLVIGTFVPFLGIVGIILLLVGLRDLARYYGDNTIFDDSLYAVIFGIIGIVAAGTILVSAFLAAASGAFMGFGVAIIIALVVAFIFYLLMAIYFRRTFDKLADKTGQGMFRTGGLLLFIGAILTIILVGLILVFIAWILLTVAFFSMTTTAQPPQPSAPPPPQTA